MEPKEVRDHFENTFFTLSREVVVAGGCVRDHLMGKVPKDFDIFILNTTKDEYEKAVSKLLEAYVPVDILLDWHKSAPFLVSMIEWQGVVVQVMCSVQKTPLSLIDQFDWNVCQFAIGRNGLIQIAEVSDIAVGEFLKLHRITYPYSTLRRGYRFSERFKMRLETKDIDRILASILALKEDKRIVV